MFEETSNLVGAQIGAAPQDQRVIDLLSGPKEWVADSQPYPGHISLTRHMVQAYLPKTGKPQGWFEPVGQETKGLSETAEAC